MIHLLQWRILVVLLIFVSSMSVSAQTNRRQNRRADAQSAKSKTQSKETKVSTCGGIIEDEDGDKFARIVFHSDKTLSPPQVAALVTPSVVLIVTQDSQGRPLLQATGFFYNINTPLIATN